MAWVEGELDTTITIDAPYDEVLSFFQHPEEFKAAFGEMEKGEEVDGGVWEWVLEEKSEKGITFQGHYKVAYTETDDGMTWESLDEGNMRSKGSSEVRDVGDGTTEVHYVERMRTDLPIPKLMAKVFRPIVSREVTKGLSNFLDNAKELLEDR